MRARAVVPSGSWPDTYWAGFIKESVILDPVEGFKSIWTGLFPDWSDESSSFTFLSGERRVCLTATARRASINFAWLGCQGFSGELVGLLVQALQHNLKLEGV